MNSFDREKILKHARKIGLEGLAQRLISEGRSEQQIKDMLLKEVARSGHVKKANIEDISDDSLTRGLTNPVLMNLD